MPFLEQVAIFLAAAVVVVPLAKRAGMGSVLGYMLAGLIVGPWALDLVDDEQEILHFAELGVVLLLFVIGLELQPRRLWAMRRAVFGLGGGQFALTTVALAGLAFALELPIEAAVVAGLALSLSSTAFALQALAERNELTTRHGRLSFSILLFQDLAVIPILALLPLLAPASAGAGGGALWLDIVKAVGMIALMVIGGRYLLRHVLRLVAHFGTHEVFTAMALLTVVGVALLMEFVGLSMALGAFLAGVLLAESEYRHELEADIEPFKGLLLGLFFMAVGMTVNIGLVIETPLAVVGLALGLMLVKMLCLIAVVRIETANWRAIRGTAVALSQGGEFAFVILALGVSSAMMDGRTADTLIVAVTLSMAATPLAFRAGDWLNVRLEPKAEPAYEQPIDEENRVIIAGFGRVGQIVGRILGVRRIGFTALETSADQVDFVRRFGNKVYYGDASRAELLRAANADKAVLFVLAIEDVEQSLVTARAVRRHFPHLTIFARARNRQHAHALMDLGITHIVRDTFHSSLELARGILTELGLDDFESRRTINTFRDHDTERLLRQHAIAHDTDRMAEEAKHWTRELEEMFAEDERNATEEGLQDPVGGTR
ncbi:MAG: monovalent cation:proton antiporter-2 (CPA2) family protein [bacterium]|nr:monovalent cation:proton antiporter-2 (CPA2) family protein [bacterium]MDE0241590.1 monovalent cation:proton antiporter-2 (CPA2) family protein [bacterium]